MSSSEHSQEEDGSSMSVGSRGLPPLPNSDRYNLIRQRLERYRRGSEGNFRTPTEIILRLPPRLPGNTVTAAHRMERGSSQLRSRGLRQDHCVDAHGRSISPNEGNGVIGRPRSQSLDTEDVPLSVSHMYNPDEMDSGSSTPTSSVSRRSSVSSCSELISALESVMADLQASQAEIEENTVTADSAIAEEPEPVSTETSDKGRSEVAACKREASLEKAPSYDLGKGWKTDLAEKEKLLNECKNQIRTLSSNKQQLERTCEEQREQLEYAMSFKIPSKCPLKRWPTICKGNVYDVLNPLNLDDVYSEPREIINALLESERRYISGLSLLHTQFEEPLKMLAVFKPDILSFHQLNYLFLNCSELLLLHRSFYEELCVIPSMASQTAQVDRLLEVCERVFPSFSIYSPFMDTSRRQNIQKELKQLGQKPQFTQLLVHCQSTCKAVNFMNLLMLPTERLNKYSDLLTYFLDPRVRALPEDGTKRAEAIIRFLRNLRYEMLDEKSQVDQKQEKVKLLQKLVPDAPIPLEIFDSEVHLVKQGFLIQVVGKKETQRMCFLFNRYIAVAESVPPTQYRILEHGMIPLSGAQLHKSVDIEGQALQPDLKSGRQEDRLAFRLSFVSNESLYFRVARPNELKGWVERLEKSIQESQQAHEQPEAEEFCAYPADIGPKIAAASLEKLFQQLTSPQIFREDFTDVFLLTHSCFTTPKDVLTALVNCVKSYEDSMSDTSSQASSNFAFPFSMEELSPCVSASPSSCNLHIESEAGSPTPGSHWTGGASPASPTPSPSNPLQRNGALDPTERKAVLSGSSFVSSSTDSDTSPHTSAVVDGNPLAAGMKNGWGIEEHELMKKAPKGLEPNDADNDPYSRLIPRERVHVGSAESEGEEEIDGDETPRNVSLSGPTTGENVPKVYLQNKAETTLHLETEDNVLTKGQSRMKHSKSMMQQLDESSHMLDMLTESLNMDFNSNPPTPSRSSVHNGNGRPRLSHSTSKDSSVFSEVEEQEHLARFQNAASGTVKRRSRTLSENATRHQVVSHLSTSEPDLVNLEVDDEDTPPPIPPRTPDMLIEAAAASREARSLGGSLVGNRMLRGSSEHSLLTASLNIGPGHHSPFHHGNAMMISPAHQVSKSALSTPERRKHSTFDNSGSRTPKKHSTGKKSNTFGRYSPVPPGEQLEVGGKASKKDKSKSRWNVVKNKVSKTFKRSPSMHAEVTDLQSSPREKRSQSIPTIRRNNVMRKTSVGPEVKLSVAVDVPDGGSAGPSPARRQRTLSTQGSGVTLITKIFSVLGCWQENYFEDFESDGELRQLLEDFLQTITEKSPTDSQEYFGALHLLESMSDKKIRTGASSSRAPSFPELLQRVTKIEPDVLKMYDWEHPDKLMAGKKIDLGKNHPKDTMFHKVMAEQLTLMEFAVYSAVQRRELLKCAWKKPDKETQAPNLCRLIRRTNEMTSWVSTEILSHVTPQQRARVIENFVQIAHHCYNHNDFHCALNITIALGSACIKSLRHTWEEVEKKYKSRLEKLKNQVDYHGRCKKMRVKLEKITEDSLQRTNKLPNALPYIGAYLDQIYALEMNSKTYNPDGLVNFAKMTKLAMMIQNVLQYQKSRFGFEPRLDVMAYVTASKRLSENDLYELSTKREPHCH